MTDSLNLSSTAKYKKELSLITPLIRNELNASVKIKNIEKYEQSFFPVVSYEHIETRVEREGEGEGRCRKQVALITRPVPSGMPFSQYFYERRYYLDIIETYKHLLTGLLQLHNIGLIYGGFGVLGNTAIMVDTQNQRAMLHNFQYTYEFPTELGGVGGVGGIGLDMFVLLQQLSRKNGERKMPPYMLLLLYLKKNGKTRFCEKDREVLEMGGGGEGSLQVLDNIVNYSNGLEALKNYAFCWDVYELTQIYLELCNRITQNNRYFRVFVEMLEEVCYSGVGDLPTEVLGRLDHIIE